MRYLTPVLIVLLLVSVIGNGVMYLKFRSHRPILSVNSTSLSKFDLDTYLEVIYGPEYKSVFVRRALIHDAAVKHGLAPSDTEITEKFQEQKQVNWQYSTTMNNNPWLADEGRKSIQEQIEFSRVQAKDIPVTEDEMKEEYNLQPALYDTPSKAECEVALLKPGVHTDDIVRLIGQDPIVKPSAIMSNFRGEVRFLGENNMYTFIQHLGTLEQSLVFNMKVGEVKKMPAPAEFNKAGFTGMVVRLIKVIKGEKAILADPKLPATDPKEKQFKKTQETLRLSVALKRANPPQETLRALFQNPKTKIETEDPNDLEMIKLKLFPPDEGTPAAQKSGK